MRMKIIIWVMFFGLIVNLSGCATIFGKANPEAVNIKSTPDLADVCVTDEAGAKIFVGTTPTVVSLEKKRGYFGGKTYKVKISKQDFTDQIITVDTQPGGWYIFGNFVFGGLIGWLIVDPLTGAMWTLDNTDINVNLEQQNLPAPIITPPSSPTVPTPPLTPELKPQKSSMIVKPGINAVLLQDVPENLRSKMVRVIQ